MSRTGQELIEILKGNIGNRASGLIGTKSVDEALTDCINDAVRFLANRLVSPNLEKEYEIPLTNSTDQYAFPTTSGRIRKISTAVIIRDGEDWGRKLERITSARHNKTWPLHDVSRNAYPRYYSVRGEVIKFFPWPDGVYATTFYVTVYPATIEASTLGDALELGDEFDETTELYATYRAHTKLQQVEDRKAAYADFKLAFKELKSSLGTTPDLYLDATRIAGRTILTTDPGNDPFVRRFNS